MASPDDDQSLPPINLDQNHLEWVVSLAVGVLIERHQITPGLARALLDVRADATGLPPIEVARWLCNTGTLP
ncbi:hypothetical protein [Kribbella sp. CA-293567]|uniref:hypothetical protein n=1 Tax=Kribbella sp. CA-293567 TaxID=3002436 RepID=UPI0022DDA393|nr:hypothetical protein [Kribbella sp. CA-293567]WBQ04340.1 hypothetical protein OX958_30790 [Kribbella sp. CA-293567]